MVNKGIDMNYEMIYYSTVLSNSFLFSRVTAREQKGLSLSTSFFVPVTTEIQRKRSKVINPFSFSRQSPTDKEKGFCFPLGFSFLSFCCLLLFLSVSLNDRVN